MGYTIAIDVYEPQAAIEAARKAGNDRWVAWLEANGAGCRPVPESIVQRGPIINRDRGLESLAGHWQSYGYFHGCGAAFYLRNDYDLDWSRQMRAVGETLTYVRANRRIGRDIAVPALNTFKCAYFSDYEGWNLVAPNVKGWSGADKRNYSQGAAMLVHAVAALRLVDGDAPGPLVLEGAVEEGARDALDGPAEPAGGLFPSAATELAYALAYTMWAHGERQMHWLTRSIEDGAAGNG